MPRAHRYILPGHIWHITRRCHQKEFLLKLINRGLYPIIHNVLPDEISLRRALRMASWVSPILP